RIPAPSRRRPCATWPSRPRTCTTGASRRWRRSSTSTTGVEDGEPASTATSYPSASIDWTGRPSSPSWRPSRARISSRPGRRRQEPPLPGGGDQSPDPAVVDQPVEPLAGEVEPFPCLALADDDGG